MHTKKEKGRPTGKQREEDEKRGEALKRGHFVFRRLITGDQDIEKSKTKTQVKDGKKASNKFANTMVKLSLRTLHKLEEWRGVSNGKAGKSSLIRRAGGRSQIIRARH